MEVRKYLRYLFLFVLVLFALNKLLIRPWVIYENLGFPYLAIVNSFPNFAEAVVGTIAIVNLMLYLTRNLNALTFQVSNRLVCLVASLLSGLYVISQELKFHNIGGNNVYDPNDVAASVVGFVFINIIFIKYGVSIDKRS